MKIRDLLFLIFIQFIWGINFVSLRFSVMDFSPILANAIRFILVFAILVPFLKIIKGNMVTVFKIAIAMGVFHFGVVMMAIAYAGGVSEVAIVAQLNVPFSVILAVFMLKEVIHWKRTLGIIISFSGVVLLGFDPRVFSHLDAAFLVAVSAVALSFASIWMRQLHNVSVLTIQAWVALAAVVGSIPLSLMAETDHLAQITSASVYGWGAILFSALFSSILGHGGMNYLFKKYEVSVISPYMLLMPLFGVGGSIFILDETLTWPMIVGGIVTMTGIVIITFRNQKRLSAKPVKPIVTGAV